MTGAAFGRELECHTYSIYLDFTLWPSLKVCYTDHVDYSAKFESEKHSFSIIRSSAQKSEITAFYIYNSVQVDFIPLDILSEFLNINGLILVYCDLPTVKSGLFKAELQKIEFLNLGSNKVESIEPQAFQYLISLKWISLGDNNLQTLPHQIFKNNPDLFYIDLQQNKINSILPNFFDGLHKLKLVDFTEGNLCIDDQIGCKTCLITQSELRGDLQDCFDNCSNDTTCLTSYRTHEASQTTEIPQTTTTEQSIESNSTEKVIERTEELIDPQLGEPSQNFTASFRNTQTAVEPPVNQELSDLKTSVENMPKIIEKAIETNNQNMQDSCTFNQKAVEKMQKAMENHLKKSLQDLAAKVETGLEDTRNVEKELKELKDFLKLELSSIIQEKLDAMEHRLTTGA
jgi:hypothetical protein